MSPRQGLRGRLVDPQVGDGRQEEVRDGTQGVRVVDAVVPPVITAKIAAAMSDVSATTA